LYNREDIKSFVMSFLLISTNSVTSEV